MSRAAEPLIALFRHAWGRSLEALCRADPVPAPPPEHVAEAAQTLAALAPGEGAALLCGELMRFLWSQNQFLTLDEGARAALVRSVEQALAVVAQGAADEALASHRTELGSLLRSRAGGALREVVCAEYAPELQLELLGLTRVELRGPVLDVGCGPTAALVRFLRARGVAAEGLDRSAPPELARVGDWLTFDYGESRWGAVLSHLGFSLHFLHHHLGPGDTAYSYARTYMALLRSLAPGGLFAYAPGLPFLEAMLDPSTYRVERVPFSDALRVSSLRRAEAESGLALSYAAHVERLL